jgi:hypothetical protein
LRAYEARPLGLLAPVRPRIGADDAAGGAGVVRFLILSYPPRYHDCSLKYPDTTKTPDFVGDPGS